MTEIVKDKLVAVFGAIIFLLIFIFLISKLSGTFESNLLSPIANSIKSIISSFIS